MTQATPNAEEILKDKDILDALNKRNAHFSQFHLQDQSNIQTCDLLYGKVATIINNEDNFAYTLRHMLVKMGMLVQVVNSLDFNPATNSSVADNTQIP